NRAAIPAGYAPADGQTLSRSLYPDVWAGIAAGNVPVATDAAWLATPTERGKFTAGDGSTTFRLPDYNGKSAGSLGALFLRGDGTLSAGTDGVIQGDEIESHRHETVDTSQVALASTPTFGKSGITRTGVAVGTAYAGETTLTAAAGGTETRPLNVTGCWVIRLFGAVVNPGAADAAQLATEVSKLGSDKVPFTAFLGANQSLAGSGYQKQPGGLILQWGVLATPGVNTTMPVTFPVSFPAACRFVGLSGIAGTIVGGSDGGCYATSLTSAGFGLVNGWDGGINPATVYWFAIGY
ncbi:phage tail protein, partial [Microvirgula aerodenitrificans]|uniref:phage tail protein n=1 Tax=Microvirgula aerodenitrificans TaxID=57480 RepID=UPI00248DE594